MGIEIGGAERAAFETYLRELTEWNKKTNLTAIEDADDILRKHFLDSLTVARALPEGSISLIDIGSGAGFPGIPLRVVRPDIRLALLEAVGKKAAFLEHMVVKLGLENASVIHARAEDIGRDTLYRESYDVAVARAVAGIGTLAEYALPLVKVGGRLIAQKSADAEDGGAAIAELGGKVSETIDIALEGVPPRRLIIIEKISSTPDKYPRRAGIPSKRPLQ